MLRYIQSFKRIFIAPDMTRQQQAVDKELRLKLKEFREGNYPDAKIHTGKIIKNVDGDRGWCYFTDRPNMSQGCSNKK